MKKEIEKFIEEKAKSIYEKYYSNNPDFPLNEKRNDKANLVNEISFILKKTLITPIRKKILDKTYSLSATDIFGADSNIFFSPNFEESLKYLSPLNALGFYENSYLDDVNKICAHEHLIHQQNNGLIPYFTIIELSRLYKDFALFIEDNSESLTETGWPEHNFTDSAWLFYKLAPNYPIEIPAYIKDFDKLKNPSNDPYFFLKKYFLNKPVQTKKIKCKTVSLSKIFSFKELGFIEDMRYKFLCLKKTILNEINQYLFLETTDKDLWFKNCAKIVFSSFSQKDLQVIASIEKKYGEITLFNNTLNGSLYKLLENILFLYKECKFKRMTFDKNTMNSILKGSKFNYQRKVTSYYQLAQFVEDDYENERYNKMMGKLNNELDKIDKEVKTNRQFRHDTLNSFKKEYLKVDYSLKQKYYPFVDNLIKSIEKGESIGLVLPFLSQLSTPSKKRITPLELPPDTKWEHIFLKFIDNESIEITGRDKYIRVATFREMGFENRKKSGRPPSALWHFLYALALTRGTLSWDILKEKVKKPDLIYKSLQTARKNKQLVSDKLKLFFNIDDDPIVYNRKEKIYQTKFSILPQDHMCNY